MFKRIYSYLRTEEGAVAAMLGGGTGMLISYSFLGLLYIEQVILFGLLVFNLAIAKPEVKK